MKARFRTLTLVAAALTVAAPASATQIKLTMSSGLDPDIKHLGALEDGTQTYGWYFTQAPVQVFEAQVVADDGLPVENACLTGGARIELLDSALAVRGGASCTNSSGKWQFVLTGTRVRTPTVITAQLLTPTTTLDGRAMAPTSSNAVATLVAGKITDTTPDSFNGTYYPVSGYITMPAVVRSKGSIKLQKQSSGTWKTLATKRTDSSGKFKFTIPYGTRGTKGTFRFRFDPPADSGWLPTIKRFTITWS